MNTVNLQTCAEKGFNMVQDLERNLERSPKTVHDGEFIRNVNVI